MMKSFRFGVLAVVVCGAALAFAAEEPSSPDASPIFGVTIPPGYRQWALIAPSVEAAPLNEVRAIVGNPTAVEAYQKATLPFPDGTILVKLAWKHVQSPAFASASVPGAVTTVQIMVKDSRRYSSMGGWGFGRFVNGKPVDEAQHQTCFGCHDAHARAHDFVFTRLAP